MTWTVLSVGYTRAPVGPDMAGGAEQVLAQLDAALVAAGHRSIVVACEGSRVSGILVPTPDPGRHLDDAGERAQAAHRRAISKALARWPVDLVHMHGLDFRECLPPPGVPVLVTLHLPPDWYPSAAFDQQRPGTYLHCVSATQHARCPAGAALLPHIPNGVPVAELSARHAKRGFALALGRICPEKGFDRALDAAGAAGIPLLIAGEVFPYEAHRRHFREAIAPRLDRWRRFIGPVGFARKRRLLTAARCVLIPSLAPETSSLVAMEAAACGTPVIAFRSGALPEVVEHGRTGFIVSDVAGMAAAIGRLGEIDPAVCRATARVRFSRERMIERYFAVYRSLVEGGDAAWRASA